MSEGLKPPLFPWTVPPSHAGRMLDGALREHDPSLSWADARALVETGKVFRNGTPCLVTRQHLRAGDTIEVRPNAPKPRERGGIGFDDFVFIDRQVAVVRKPAGVSTVPFEPGERGTLDEMVRVALDRQARTRGGPAQGWIGVVHRLDKDTSGLLVFARTLAAKRHLGNQFRAHSVERRYIALAHGTVRSQTIRSRLVPDRGDGLRGSTRLPNAGQEAVTHIEALEPLGAATLVACRLETGRTHQIRIHLSEAGHPLVGEDVYIRDFRGERVQAGRQMLHAEELGFIHPATDESMLFRDEWPDDFDAVVEQLRAGKPAAPAPRERERAGRPHQAGGGRAPGAGGRGPGAGGRAPGAGGGRPGAGGGRFDTGGARGGKAFGVGRARGGPLNPGPSPGGEGKRGGRRS